MKIRTGFVSNSSSSSFVLVGFILDESREEELYNIFTQEQKDFAAQKTLKMNWTEIEKGDRQYAINNSLGIQISDNEEQGAPKGKIMIGIEHEFGESSDNTAVFNYSDIKNTLKQIADKLSLKFPEDLVVVCDVKAT